MKKSRPSILGVGHCCQDCICTVEAYPPEDGSTHVLSMDDSQGGGAVATALAAAAKLGADARMLALVGDDPAGNRIVEGLASFGVGTELISRVPGGRSSTSWVMVNPATGSRTKFPYRDALPPLEFDHRAREAIAKADAVHLDGTRYENALKAALLAREAGVPVSLDGCSRQQDSSLNLKLSSLADILIMNAVYPFRVSGLGDREDALRFFGEQRPRPVIIMTAGSDGVYALKGGRILHFPAYPVHAVDTTGAGDVFHGAFLTRWLETADLEESIRFGQAASALKCLKPGGRAGIPDREALERFMSGHAGDPS